MGVTWGGGRVKLHKFKCVVRPFISYNKINNMFYIICDCIDILQCGKAVSYTHLDVYKRQVPYSTTANKIRVFKRINKAYLIYLDV